MTSTTIDVDECDFNKVEPYATIALLGKRRSGKTTWAMEIMRTLNKSVDRFIAMCGHKDNMAEWKKSIGALYVMPKNLNVLKALITYQANKCAPYTRAGQPIPRKYRVVLVLDDCGADRAFMFHPIVRDVCSNGRHYGMDVLFLIQYLMQMHAENRQNFDYIGMLYTSNSKNIKKVFDEYVSVTDIRTFRFILNACTTNRGLLWLDNTTNPGTIKEAMFHKRIVPPFLPPELGNHAVREYAESHHIEQEEDGKAVVPEMREPVSDDDGVCEEKVPSLMMNNRNVFSDKLGTVVIRRQATKEKPD